MALLSWLWSFKALSCLSSPDLAPRTGLSPSLDSNAPWAKRPRREDFLRKSIHGVEWVSGNGGTRKPSRVGDDRAEFSTGPEPRRMLAFLGEAV
jgi:hypothetical protein